MFGGVGDHLVSIKQPSNKLKNSKYLYNNNLRNQTYPAESFFRSSIKQPSNNRQANDHQLT